jgi:hypothetical protein
LGSKVALGFFEKAAVGKGGATTPLAKCSHMALLAPAAFHWNVNKIRKGTSYFP